MNMIPNMPALGIRFDISKMDSATYAIACWKIFWSAVDIGGLGGALLFEGDKAASPDGKEKVYCLAVQSSDGTVLNAIRAALEKSAEFQKAAASPAFVEGAQVTGEPLTEAGQIDSAGNLVGAALNSGPALDAVRKEAAEQPASGTEPAVSEEQVEGSWHSFRRPEKKWWQFWK